MSFMSLFFVLFVPQTRPFTIETSLGQGQKGQKGQCHPLLYSTVIRKLCMKHQFEALPKNFSANVMPELNINQLDNKVTHISLNDMYNYKKRQNLSKTQFKTNCIKNWNKLPMDLKVLPYLSGKECLHRALKTIKNYSKNELN